MSLRRAPEPGWAATRASKEEYWRKLTPAQRLLLSDELRRHALALHPDWPTDAQRASDFAAHVRLAERMNRAAASRKR